MSLLHLNKGFVVLIRTECNKCAMTVTAGGDAGGAYESTVERCVQVGASTHRRGARQRVQRGWTERAGGNHV